MGVWGQEEWGGHAKDRKEDDYHMSKVVTCAGDINTKGSAAGGEVGSGSSMSDDQGRLQKEGDQG